MPKPEQNWIERPGRDPEREARTLQQRFSKVTDRYERAVENRKFLRSTRATIMFAMLAAGLAFLAASAIL